MSVGVLVFHPQLEHSTVDRALSHAIYDMPQVDVHDVYKLYPDFQIDVQAEQEFLTVHDHVIFQFPMYWYSMPPLMRAWEDAVFTHGWAYGSTGHALQGKTYRAAVSIGVRQEKYSETGEYHVTAQTLLKPLETLQYNTGMVWEEPFIVFGGSSLTPEQLQTKQAAYRELIQQYQQ